MVGHTAGLTTLEENGGTHCRPNHFRGRWWDTLPV